MTLLQDLIDIPTSVEGADFVVRASGEADLGNYVVTDNLRHNFDDALRTVGHAVTSGRSQAKFLHGSFGSGKSHFMSVLREILKHNPQGRLVPGLAEPVSRADSWLSERKILTLTFHMLDARSVEQAILEGYLRQIAAAHPDVPPPAVHRSDALLDDAARLRERMGDTEFLAGLGETPGLATETGLAAERAAAAGWTAETYAAAAAQPPGTEQRDLLIGALTSAYFRHSVHGGEYLDLDTGLAVITRHAKGLGYDTMVLFLDELILWLSTKLAHPTFVNTEGAKLNKLVESSDASRPLPIVSFVARQRNLEEFLGPQVGGTEREALAHVMRSVQGRLGEIVLPDTNLPEITEKRLLKPKTDAARQQLDQAFAAVRGNRSVWDILLLGAQFGDAGIGSDAAAFRKLYPFSPALVATLVALSQALQRERTALRVMTELLVERRDTLRVNDLIGVSALFEPLVLHGELPDRPKLKQQFQSARETYTGKLRPLLLAQHGITEAQVAGHEAFALDDRLIKTLLIGALVPEVPALQQLTAGKLHALNFGSIAAPVPGYEKQIVLDRLRRLSADAGELHLTEGTDPVISLKLSSMDYDKLLDYAPDTETATGMLQQLVREVVLGELNIAGATGTLGELLHTREWRGRRHSLQVRFGNIRDRDSMPEAALIAPGSDWRVVIDYPFDMVTYNRRSDLARITELPRGSRTVFWLPLFLTDEMMGRVNQLAKINYLLGSDGTGDRLSTLAADYSTNERAQGKVYLQQRQQQLRSALISALKQAYGAAKPDPGVVQTDDVRILHTLSDGLHLGDPIGGTLAEAFRHLTGQLLRWSYPGKQVLPEEERVVTPAEMTKVLKYAQRAAADATHGVTVEQADRRSIARICNNLQLGELVDHRYVLTSSTCWWSRHLLQHAAQDGHKERFPVHALRSYLDRPEPRGFDPALQNLIIAVFAAEQQLAWYQQGGKTEVTAVAGIRDDLELRHPPMPAEADWRAAVARAQGLLGEVPPAWLSPATLADTAATLRRIAGQHTSATAALVAALEKRAAILGLAENASTGRLATGRRVRDLVVTLARENDDVVFIQLVARADLGGVEDQVAGAAIKQAASVEAALRSVSWPLLETVQNWSATGNSEATAILAALREAAGYEQHGTDLGKALRAASDAAAKLLARTPKPKVVEPDPTPKPDKTELEVVEPGSDKADPPQRVQRADVTDRAELERVVEQIRAQLAAGRRVNVTWEVR